MNARKNKKVLIALSSVMALGTLGAVLAFSRSEDSLSRAGSGISSSIVFSRDGAFTKIDDTTASVSGASYYGNTYYAVSRNNGDISETNYVAKFGGSNPETKYVTFSTTSTGMGDFEFQGITGIKVWTTSSSAQTLYLDYSSDGSSFSTFETIYGSTSPDKYTFSSSHKYVRLRGYSTFERNVTKIELFYDCGEAEPAAPDHIAAYNAKNYYSVGDAFVKPEVRMIFSDSSTEVISASDVSCSGYDMSTAGAQTVSVSATYLGVVYNTSYSITVVDPSATSHSIAYEMFSWSDSDYLDYHDYLELDECVMPTSFNEGESTTIKIVFSNTAYEMWGLSIVESEDWESWSTSDGVTFTCTFPNMDVTLTLNVGLA